MIEIITAISLWELIKHTSAWVTNLKRAKETRKQQSVNALRKVVIAAQKTAIYMRLLQEGGKQSLEAEAELATLWTELSFALQDLGIDKLAKRCLIKGKQWANPTQLDKAFLDKADVGLEKMEQLANQLLSEINH